MNDKLATSIQSTLPGLPDDVFENDGLITKRHQRASAFAFLRPAPSELLWDIGTGSGAMAIEWCRAAEGATAIGLERNVERAQRAQRNIDRLAPGHVQLVIGDAAANLGSLDAPDAVFFGGGVSLEAIEASWQALKPGGRIVAHGVTLDTDALLADAYRAHGGLLSRIDIATAQPLGRFLAWNPARPVTQWAAIKPAS